MEKRKIAFFIGSLDRGGTETYLLRFLDFLNQQYMVTVVVKNIKDGPIKPSLENKGASVVTKQVGYLNLLKWKKLLRWFKEEKFDVVCDFTGNFAGIPLFLSYLAGVQVRIAFYRNSSYRFKPNPFKMIYFKMINKLVYKYATKILSNSKYALFFFFKRYSPQNNKFKVIPNGVNTNEFNVVNQSESRKLFQLPQSAKIIGHVGRYNPAKNHKTIAEVVRLLCEDDPNIFIVLCGKGTDTKRCKSLFHNVPDNQIKFLGSINNIEKLYSAFDIFYFPSITEGQPNALIEAMISKLPIIASDIEAIKECIPPDKTYQLIPPNDVETAFVTIKECLQSKRSANQHTYFEFATKKFRAKDRLDKFKIEIAPPLCGPKFNKILKNKLTDG